MARIVIVEDSEDLREATAVYLKHEGHEVFDFRSVDELSGAGLQCAPDLYILDIMLPGQSGIGLSHSIRMENDAPIIFVSARHDEMTKTAAFNAGADDYVVKPYSLRELSLRVQAVPRRVGSRDGTAPSPEALNAAVLNTGGVLHCQSSGRAMAIDLKGRRVEIDGEEISLTRTEWRILETLCRSADAVVTRDQLMHQVFGYDGGVESRSIDTHVKNLRRKLGPTTWIETVHGQGFRLARETEA